MLPIEFQVNWPFSTEEEAKNRFSCRPPQRPLGIPIGTIFAIFDSSTIHSDASYPVSSQLAYLFKRRSEKQIFIMAATEAIFDLQPARFSYFLSTSHPDASYQVSSKLAFGSGQEAKNRFSRWSPRCFLPGFESIDPEL